MICIWICEVDSGGYRGRLPLISGEALSQSLVALSVLVLCRVARYTTLLHSSVAPDVCAGEAPILLEDHPDREEEDHEPHSEE